MKTGIQVFLWVLCIFFSYKIYDSISKPINFNQVKYNRYYDVIDRLKEKKLIYEKDGAVWFKA